MLFTCLANTKIGYTFCFVSISLSEVCSFRGGPFYFLCGGGGGGGRIFLCKIFFSLASVSFLL